MPLVLNSIISSINSIYFLFPESMGINGCIFCPTQAHMHWWRNSRKDVFHVSGPDMGVITWGKETGGKDIQLKDMQIGGRRQRQTDRRWTLRSPHLSATTPPLGNMAHWKPDSPQWYSSFLFLWKRWTTGLSTLNTLSLLICPTSLCIDINISLPGYKWRNKD